jgi:hypothetical protein
VKSRTKFEFEIERYWKFAIAILIIAFIVVYVQPYGSYDMIVMAVACMMTISIYKHLNRDKLMPEERPPKPRSKKKKKKKVMTEADHLESHRDHKRDDS